MEGDPLTIAITSVRQDEPTSGTGNSDLSPDGQGIGTATAQVRAERVGNGNGRYYYISFTAKDGQVNEPAGSCSGVVQISIPKHMSATGAAGNDNYNAASSLAQSFVVRNPTLTNQAITFDPLPDMRLGDAPFTLTATASSGLTVTFVTQTPAVCTVEGETVTLLAAGFCTIQATQAGNDRFNPATPVTRTFQVAPGVAENHRLYLPVVER